MSEKRPCTKIMSILDMTRTEPSPRVRGKACRSQACQWKAALGRALQRRRVSQAPRTTVINWPATAANIPPAALPPRTITIRSMKENRPTPSQICSQPRPLKRCLPCSNPLAIGTHKPVKTSTMVKKRAAGLEMFNSRDNGRIVASTNPEEISHKTNAQPTMARVVARNCSS